MFKLVLKDILVQKKTLAFALIYIIFTIFAFEGLVTGVFPTACVAVVYMLLLTACAYEDKNKCDIMINSLPIERKNVVLAKYLSVYIYALISAAVYFVATTLLQLVKVPVNIYPISLESFTGALFAVSLTSSLFLPVFFKLGYIKSKIFNFILFFLVFGGIGAIGTFLSHSNPWLGEKLAELNKLPNVAIAAVIILISIFIQLVSYFLSVAFYKSREFN